VANGPQIRGGRPSRGSAVEAIVAGSGVAEDSMTVTPTPDRHGPCRLPAGTWGAPVNSGLITTAAMVRNRRDPRTVALNLWSRSV
jgi:hypothetical protein